MQVELCEIALAGTALPAPASVGTACLPVGRGPVGRGVFSWAY